MALILALPSKASKLATAHLVRRWPLSFLGTKEEATHTRDSESHQSWSFPYTLLPPQRDQPIMRRLGFTIQEDTHGQHS
jgi:hypothetical protein